MVHELHGNYDGSRVAWTAVNGSRVTWKLYRARGDSEWFWKFEWFTKRVEPTLCVGKELLCV